MAKYQNEVKELLEAIGGKENISAVSHCMTRMRFVLADEKKADMKRIEQISCVKGTFTQAGQFQVIIGNDVSTFFNEFTAYAGVEGVSKDAAKQAAKSNQTWIQKLRSNLGEIFAPIIPALICGGLVLGFRHEDAGGDFPVLGRRGQLSVADRRGGVLAPAGGNRLVHHEEDGNHPDAGYCSGTDACLLPAAQRI